MLETVGQSADCSSGGALVRIVETARRYQDGYRRFFTNCSLTVRIAAYTGERRGGGILSRQR
jgi:hypothetical protein